MQLSWSLLLAALLSQNSNAFSIGTTIRSSSVATPTTLSATLESPAETAKKSLVSPSEIPDDDVAGMFDKFVQKTYG